MKHSFPPAALALLAGAGALLGSCASTPQSRIEANPALYQGLSGTHKSLVSQGKIAEGMSPEAVFIAWGKADNIRTSSERGQITETWIYRGTEPEFVHTSHFGYGYGRYYGHGYYYPDFCYGPTVYYRSYIAGTVTFRNRRVVRWEVTGP